MARPMPLVAPVMKAVVTCAFPDCLQFSVWLRPAQANQENREKQKISFLAEFRAGGSPREPQFSAPAKPGVFTPVRAAQPLARGALVPKLGFPGRTWANGTAPGCRAAERSPGYNRQLVETGGFNSAKSDAAA